MNYLKMQIIFLICLLLPFLNTKNEKYHFDDFDCLSEIVNNIPITVLLDNIKDRSRQRTTIVYELRHQY